MIAFTLIALVAALLWFLFAPEVRRWRRERYERRRKGFRVIS